MPDGATRISPPTLSLDPATLANLDADLDREWLVTNGLGGYAMGTVAGAPTRSYHGLLVAATQPPVGRSVLVTKIDETVLCSDGSSLELGTTEYADGTVNPHGYQHLADFTLDGSVPRWIFRIGDGATLEKRIWMERGHNLTYVQYRYAHAASNSPSPSLTLTLSPFCLERDHHSTTRGAPDWHFLVEAETSACTVRAFEEVLPFRLIAGPAARFTAAGEWYWHIFHRAEHARGLDDAEDVYLPGRFSVTLAPGETASLVLSASTELPMSLAGIGDVTHEILVGDALDRERRRCAALLERAGPLAPHDALVAHLILAADQFLVTRPRERSPSPSPADEAGVTVIAGYPWFTDWGRDTMIALPGLTLATNRFEEARNLLRTFSHYVDHGMIPNRFPDAGTPPEYNTADATLWYLHALGQYLDVTGDFALLTDLFPLADDIIAWHVRGTRYGIGVDPEDGLLRAGEPGVQLTWMDARVDDRVVTPRSGKAIEINALWYHALIRMEEWAVRLDCDPGRYARLRQAFERSFLSRFWYEAGGYFFDVVDVDGHAGKVDWSLRPNQIFALTFARPLIPDSQARSALEHVQRALLTPLGLRTLAPEDPRYIGTYGGSRHARDAAYHQGTVWPWLLGAYVDACHHVHGEGCEAGKLLAPFATHLRTAGIGSVTEIADGDPPFTSRGCIAQAWSVAELLRIARRSALAPVG